MTGSYRVHPHYLTLGGGGLLLSLGSGPGFWVGHTERVAVGGRIHSDDHFDLRLGLVGQSAHVSHRDQEISIAGMGGEAGLDWKPHPSIHFGLHTGMQLDFYQADGPHLSLQNTPAVSFHLRPSLCLLNQLVCASYGFAQVMGLNVAPPSATPMIRSGGPQWHSFLLSLDLLRSLAPVPTALDGLRAFTRGIETSAFALSSWNGVVTSSPPVNSVGEIELPFRTIDRFPSWIPRMNHLHFLARRNPSENSPFGATIGVNLSQDLYYPPTDSPRLSGLENDLLRQGLTFALVPAFVAYQPERRVTLEAGIFPGNIGPENPMAGVSVKDGRALISLSRFYSAQPFFISGGRGRFSLDFGSDTEGSEAYVGIVNRSDTFLGREPNMTLIAGLFTIYRGHSLAVNLLAGNESTGFRGILDFVWSREFTPYFSASANVDLGTRVSVQGEQQYHVGGNAVGELRLSRDYRWALVGRVEAIVDGGSGLGSGELALLSWAVGLRRTFRPARDHQFFVSAELQGDHVSPLGESPSPFGNSNALVTLGLNAAWRWR